MELISFKFFKNVIFIFKLLHHDIINILNYFTGNNIIMRMSRVTYNLYIKLIVSFGATLYKTNPFLCSHGYISSLYIYHFIFYIKSIYLDSFKDIMQIFYKVLVVHVFVLLYPLYMLYFLCFIYA